jgi:hypothetical protein
MLDSEVREVLSHIGASSDEIEIAITNFLKVESLWDALSTPREIYRYINLLTYTFQLIKNSSLLNEVNKLDVMLLSLLQFISPAWYKVLRDRNDKLLDYNSNSGRYYLNADRVEAFYTQATHNMLRQALKHRNRKERQTEQKNATPTLSSIREEVQLDPFNALKGIIFQLFGSSTDSKKADRICYEKEYFKYFAGHYKKDEMSSSKAFSLLELKPSQFDKELAAINSETSIKSFIHKALIYVSEGRYNDRVDILKKLLKLAEKCFSSENVSMETLYRGSELESVVFNLFMRLEKSEEALEDSLRAEKDSLLQLIGDDSRFDFLSMFLKTWSIDENWHFVYGDDLPIEMREFLIERFISEKVKVSPFADETVRLMPYIRNMYPVLWEERFKDHVRRGDEPLAWLYNMITVNSKGEIVWNLRYIYALGDNIVNLKIFASELLGDSNEIEQGVLADMGVLNVGVNGKSLTESRHPFVAAAMNWHRTKKL